MAKIKFTQDYRARNMILYNSGDVKELDNSYAIALIDAGIAKSVDSPRKHKMVEKPAEKKHYYVG